MKEKGIKSFQILTDIDLKNIIENQLVEKLKKYIEDGTEFSKDLYIEYSFSKKTIKELEGELAKLEEEKEQVIGDKYDFEEQNEDEENPYENEYEEIFSKIENVRREIGLRFKTIFLNPKYKDKKVLLFGGIESNAFSNKNIVFVDGLEKVYITNRNNMVSANRMEIDSVFVGVEFLFPESIVEIEEDSIIVEINKR